MSDESDSESTGISLTPSEFSGARTRAWFNVYSTHNLGGVAPRAADLRPVSGLEVSFLSLSGVDDSVSPRTLCDISQKFAFVEWGVNFRAEMQGREPGYASLAWLRRLQEEIDRRQRAKKFVPIHLAAHLGGEYCMDVLRGDMSLVRTLWEDYGFLRIHLQPMRSHGVDSSQLKKYFHSLRSVIVALPQVEFVLPASKETRALVVQMMSDCRPNLGFFYDAEDDGELIDGAMPRRSPPCPHPGIHCGYGGHLTVDNLAGELGRISNAVGSPGRAVWIDLESGLRTQRGGAGQDEFDLCKALACIRTVYDLNLPRPRPTLASR